MAFRDSRMLAEATAELDTVSRALEQQYPDVNRGKRSIAVDLANPIDAARVRQLILDGDLALGIWQALYVWEHRTAPHRRTLLVHVAGE